jgi:hypothetical protein
MVPTAKVERLDLKALVFMGGLVNALWAFCWPAERSTQSQTIT